MSNIFLFTLAGYQPVAKPPILEGLGFFIQGFLPLDRLPKTANNLDLNAGNDLFLLHYFKFSIK
jgi:hypothetical protein